MRKEQKAATGHNMSVPLKYHMVLRRSSSLTSLRLPEYFFLNKMSEPTARQKELIELRKDKEAAIQVLYEFIKIHSAIVTKIEAKIIKLELETIGR